MSRNDLTFKISGKSAAATKLNVNARQFNLIVDEPATLGGEDAGPNPVEYLLAGYAGCLNVVVNLVAKELGVKIEKLDVNVSGNLNPARFMGLSDEERAGFKSIDVDISLQSNADEETRKELFRLVEKRCPINDNIKNPTPISYSIN